MIIKTRTSVSGSGGGTPFMVQRCAVADITNPVELAGYRAYADGAMVVVYCELDTQIYTWRTAADVDSPYVVAGSAGYWVRLDASTSVFATDIEFSTSSIGLVQRAPNGTRWRRTIEDNKEVTRTSITASVARTTTHDIEITSATCGIISVSPGGIKYRETQYTDGSVTRDETTDTGRVYTEDLEITDYTKGLIRVDEDGVRWRETVNDDGSATRTSL